MEDINLHLLAIFQRLKNEITLLSAVIDNNFTKHKIFFKSYPKSIAWKRVMDMNDRSCVRLLLE